MMCVLVLPLFYGLLFLLWAEATGDRREACIGSAIVYGVLVEGIAEFLSAFHALTPPYLLATWVTLTLPLAWMALRRRPFRRAVAPTGPWTHLDRALLGGLGLILALTGALVVTAAPNDFDGLYYHLPRVVEWLQNRSVQYYPTNIVYQLFDPPWGEYAMLHLQALAGSDRLDTLAQWLAFVLCLVGASLVARRLGAAPAVQVGAAVVAGTLPIAILQSTGTHNNCMEAAWLVAFAYYSLAVMQDGGRLSDCILAAASLGLALDTKNVGYIFALPFLVWTLGSLLRRHPARAWRWALITAAVAVAINSGLYVRNMQVFGQPVGAPGVRYTTEGMTLPLFVSNSVRNLALQLVTPVGWSVEETAILGLHRALGVDVNDPRITYPDMHFALPPFTNNECSSANPLHLVLCGAALLAILGRGPQRRQPYLAPYATAAILAAVLFCWLIKWQPWHTRLHVPLFMLFAPVVAIGVYGISPTFLKAVSVVLLLLAIPVAAGNETRPLLGEQSVLTTDRISQYFHDRPELERPFRQAVQVARSHAPDDYGLALVQDRGNSIEYTLWVLLAENRSGPLHIENVLVENLSAACGPVPFVPAAILSLQPGNPATMEVQGAHYVRRYASGQIAAYIRE